MRLYCKQCKQVQEAYHEKEWICDVCKHSVEQEAQRIAGVFLFNMRKKSYPQERRKK